MTLTLAEQDGLKRRQEAGMAVEKKMIDMLLQFTPAQNLTVADIKLIASCARQFSFETFSLAD